MRHAFMSIQNATVTHTKDMTLVDLVDLGEGGPR